MNSKKEVLTMQCGAKCFTVEIEKQNGERVQMPIKARSPVLARKVARTELAEPFKIISVKADK